MGRQRVCPDCKRVTSNLASHVAWTWGHPKARRIVRRQKAEQRKKARSERRRQTASIRKELAAHKKAQGVH